MIIILLRMLQPGLNRVTPETKVCKLNVGLSQMVAEVDSNQLSLNSSKSFLRNMLFDF